jgi:DNA-binding CsgD family transcriptional regulator
MTDLADLSTLIALIYEAALDFERWPMVLAQVSDAIGGSTTGLFQQNLATGVGEMVISRGDPAYATLYADYYSKRNELWERAGQKPPGTIITDRAVMPKEEFFRTEFFNGFVKPLDSHSLAALYLLIEGHWGAVIGFGRAPSAGEWEREHLDLLRLLLPHLRRAAQVNLRLQRQSIDQTNAFDALDLLARGVIIADGDSRAVFVNKTAAEIIAAGDGLGIDPGGLCAASTRETATIRQLIRRTALQADPHAAGGAVAVSRPSLQRPISLLVAPLPRPTGWFALGRAAVVVFVHDPERSAPIPSLHLQQLYGLTPAEAALATEVARGQGLQVSADLLGIARSTANTHLQHVFQKTQTNRQTELVRLIAELEASLAFDRSSGGKS